MEKTEKLIHTIYWDSVSGASYLYGSQISFLSNKRIFFKNPRMASGTVLQEWHSKVNYQASRTTAQLPLLFPNKTYKVVAQVATVPENRLYYRISFFNRQEEEIEFVVHKTGEGEFICPEGTFYYNIQLISAGCEKVSFDCLRLYQVDDVLTSDSGLNQTVPRAYYQKDIFPPDLQFMKELIKQSKFKKEVSEQ